MVDCPCLPVLHCHSGTPALEHPDQLIAGFDASSVARIWPDAFGAFDRSGAQIPEVCGTS